MSSSSASSSPKRQQEESDVDDPLDITENDRKKLKESEAVKRKCNTPDDSDFKKLKTDENGTADLVDDEIATKSPSNDVEKLEKPESEIRAGDESKDEIETQETVISTDDDANTKPNKDQNEESSETDKNPEKKEKKVQNLRKNIKDVLDESQLDATTLAAQRLESERLARVQEQQRLIREAQRQMAAEKQANKTQQKVLSLLQGDGDALDPSRAEMDLDDQILDKFSLGSALNITPAAKAALQSIQSLITSDETIPDSEGSDDDVVIQPDPSTDKSKAVVVDSSSDSDDCIILSDDEDEGVEEEDENNSGEHTNDAYNQRDAEGRVVVNIGHQPNEAKIYVAPQIARVIKPHQIGGVRFLFDNIIESTELFNKSSGFGCILAHSMGLGKTIQLVCFCDIFLRHTSSKSILIIMPINTLQNWLHEFNMWTPLPEDVDKSPLKEGGEVRPRQFNIFVMNDSQKTLNARAKTVLDWSKEGGVLLMGYEIYRLLSLKKMKQKKKKGAVENDVPTSEDQDLFDRIHAALVNPGPDLVVCDEGHRIKNAHASTSMALKQIKTKRRIVLTGYPLQNNLLEYWCMVDFVRPSYLGTKTEFSNMFERPILNGQCIDSTPQDVKLMRYRAHVLHSLLKGFVQRRSHTVLQKCLPEKTEFVILVRMTAFQRKLYSIFMDEVVRSRKVPNPLKAFSVCCKIWNHPDVLYNFLKKRELDLDIELEEAEAIGKTEATPGPKKRGRKTKETPKKKEKEEEKSPEKPVEVKTEVKTEKPEVPDSNGTTTDSFKPPMTPSSNDSAYSSNQSVNSSFDSTNYNNSYSGFQNYESNWNGGYQQSQQSSWNSGSSYWQNNYYQSQSEYGQGYFQQNSYQQPYYGNSNFQSFDQKPPVPKLEPIELKPEGKETGGLLDDVIKEETKEQREKDEDLKDLAKDLAKTSKDDGIPYDWAVDLMKDYIPDLIQNSPKMEVFFCILDESIKMGDRLLVFSQSLLTLNILERFLQRTKIPNSDPEVNWAKNTSYFRLDGSTTALEREKLINEFNANLKVKLFLVSTRAGSLGINLVGANRAVVFDASWNPCHDTQAVCRVYRYGQVKQCYVYRFVMDNCLEKKIYDRQINKQGMADRVVDECNPDANLSMKEVTSLCYDDGEDPEIKEFTEDIAEFKDSVTKIILERYWKALTKKPFQHESLLVDRKEKKLSLAEKRLAQRGYEMEKQAATRPTFNYNSYGSNYRAFRTTDGSLIHRPVGSVRPMQSEIGDTMNPVRHGNNPPKPNRWVPVEVWQSKGLTAQEMTLPQDVSIQTNSADKSKIYLKAGQKVIVLKSPKGICLQLESGKVIAIRASVKGGQQPQGGDQKLGNFSGMPENPERPKYVAPRSDGDVIDISNDDDEEVSSGMKSMMSDVPVTQSLPPVNGSKPPESTVTSSDPVYKEKVVYKPNLVPRSKPKMPPPSIPVAENPRFDSLSRQQPKWDSHKNFSTSSSNMYNRNMNGGSKGHVDTFRNSDTSRRPDEPDPVDTSAFHQPPGPSNLPPPSGNFHTPSYSDYNYSNPNYPAQPAPSGNYNYPYQPYQNAPPASYHYPPQSTAPGNFDPNYQPYQNYNSLNYSQLPPPPQSYPPPINPDSTQGNFTAPPSSNYGQWNYNT